MPRKRKRPVSFRLTEEQVIFLDLLASDCGGCSRSQVIGRLLDLCLIRYHAQVAARNPTPNTQQKKG